MITAKILADSVNPSGSRLTSFILTYPRFIHAELMTHRAFSRNAASSRAIPLSKMIEAIMENPALPEYWGAEKKGMQSGDSLALREESEVKDIWLDIREDAIWAAEECATNGLHKSLCNRLIEPWAHITVLVTASDAGLANFFALRAEAMAEPTFQVLAYRMLAQYAASIPREIPWGGWHIPAFKAGEGSEDITFFEGKWVNTMRSTEDQIKIATARCARLSYLTHDGEHSPEKDIKLHDDLLKNRHLSPFEHCAQAISPEMGIMGMFKSYPWSNFDSSEVLESGAVMPVPCGWGQYRKAIGGENQTVINPAAIMAIKPEWITL